MWSKLSDSSDVKSRRGWDIKVSHAAGKIVTESKGIRSSWHEVPIGMKAAATAFFKRVMVIEWEMRSWGEEEASPTNPYAEGAWYTDNTYSIQRKSDSHDLMQVADWFLQITEFTVQMVHLLLLPYHQLSQISWTIEKRGDFEHKNWKQKKSDAPSDPVNVWGKFGSYHSLWLPFSFVIASTYSFVIISIILIPIIISFCSLTVINVALLLFLSNSRKEIVCLIKISRVGSSRINNYNITKTSQHPFSRATVAAVVIQASEQNHAPEFSPPVPEDISVQRFLFLIIPFLPKNSSSKIFCFRLSYHMRIRWWGGWCVEK